MLLSSINDVAGLNGPSISVKFLGKLKAIHKATDGYFVHSKPHILYDGDEKHLFPIPQAYCYAYA
jgi:hypothetical protein